MRWTRAEKITAALSLVIALTPVSLKCGAVKVRAQERADSLEYITGCAMASIGNYREALRLSSEDMEIAYWALSQRRSRGRIHRKQG